MKRNLLKHTLLLIVYVLAHLYFAIFNWKIFIVNLNIDLGFGVVTFPPFLSFFLLGFLFIGFLSWRSYMTQLQRRIFELEQGVELGKLRDRMLNNKLRQFLSDEKNVEMLNVNLGIKDLTRRMGELEASVREIKDKTSPSSPAATEK